MDIANPLHGIVEKDDIAPGGVAAKGETGGGVLDLRGQTQDDSIVAVTIWVRLEATGIVLELVVGLNAVRLIPADDVGRVFLGQALDFLSSRVGVGVEDAYYVGDILIGEARVLLPFSPWIENILGRCRRSSSSWSARMPNEAKWVVGRRTLGGLFPVHWKRAYKQERRDQIEVPFFFCLLPPTSDGDRVARYSRCTATYRWWSAWERTYTHNNTKAMAGNDHGVMPRAEQV